MTTTTTKYAQDRALQSLIRDARRAIRKSEGRDARNALADFNEQLSRRTVPERVRLCNWWIRMAGVNDHE